MFNKSRLFAVFTALTLIFSVWITYAININADIADSVLRLHILANSDSYEDQELKIKVRNRILDECGEWFKSATTPDESANIARENLDKIRAIAEDEIKKHGYNYPVTVTVGDSRFPTKAYGNIYLPAGKYQAIRILIGEGAGENWWCVMYPPLCLINGVTNMPEESEEKLRSSLSEEEYRLLTETDTPQIQIKFKAAELIGRIFLQF